MPSDLVSRLRDFARHLADLDWHVYERECIDAADRIEQLEAGNDALGRILNQRDEDQRNTDARIDQLEAENAAMREVVEAAKWAKAEWHTSHYMHWDREGHAGRSCPACQLDHELRVRIEDAIAKLEEARRGNR